MGKIWDFITAAPPSSVDPEKFMERHKAHFDQEPGQRFSIGIGEVDPAIIGMDSWTSSSTRVSRDTAMAVPAIKRARDLIAGTLGQLPIAIIGPNKQAAHSALLAQPEVGVPRSVTMTRTFEDLLLEKVAWWRITEWGWHGYPTHVKRLDPSTVSVRAERVYVKTANGNTGSHEEWVPDRELIRFDSPNDALLVAGARAIRSLILLEKAAAHGAEGVPPIDYFEPTSDVDPFEDDDEAAEFLDEWNAARRARRTGIVPAGLKLATHGWNPEQLQLSDQRQHAVLEIARLTGIDPEELGVSTTSRTYSNQQDRRKAFLDFTLGGYRQAIEDRLSMTDVTPMGYVAKFTLSAFLRSDDLTRMQTYEIGLRVGAYTLPEIRELEDKQPLTTQEESAAVAASMTHRVQQFNTEPVIRLDAPGAQTFKVDQGKRTIKGLAVPYNKVARSDGQLWSFSKGTIKYADVSYVKLWINHDYTQAVGVATKFEESDAGLVATFKVARGAEGDRALILAEDGVLDGLSIGLAQGGKYTLDESTGVYHAVEAPLMEVSLTPAPAYDDARVHAVAASAAKQKGNTMQCTKCGTVHADGVTECAAPEVTLANDESALDFSPITDALKQGFEAMAEANAKPKPVISPRQEVPAGAQLQVTEASPYRFDGVRGKFDFSTDLIAGLRDHDAEALARVQKFMHDEFTPKFDVDTGNVTTLNPARQRPDLYVDERRFKTPLYDALHKGAITDMTPFIVPKFNSASGLVAPHVEGVEPTPGAFTATSQTITPSAVSGKVEITREVWDQGGNPQVSGIIWAKMVQHYFAALEVAAYDMLTAASPTGIPITAGLADDDLVNAVEAAIVDLNFVAGGNTFDFAAAHANLYKKLAAAVDSTGRKLLPLYGPTNASGQARPKGASLDVSGVEFSPVPSLGAASNNVSSSYLIDTESVHLWNSAPQRLEFQYRVAYVDLAIWGYVAGAITDLAGVREITYDPVA